MPNEVFRKSKVDLAKVSPTFCLAKWLQVTLHLHNGTTHSCHHPRPHKIQIDDILNNPTGLHNTKEKMAERAQMLSGVQPKACEYCWNIENSNSSAFSDRIMKSASDWSLPYFNEVVRSGLGATINPRYLEISFSNICNFKCSYCSADYSTKWQQEIELMGPYTSGNGSLTGPILEEDNNPYIEAFWKWWPDLKKDLHVFRITGGEPLLSKNTWKILNDIDENPVPHLQIAINSNLGVPTEIITRLISKLKKLLLEKKIADFRVFTSIDTIGENAELIRHGLNSDLFFKHLDLLLVKIPTLRVVIMSTYSAISVLKYTELLKAVLALRKKYTSSARAQPLGLSTSYLRYPEHLSVKILSPAMLKYPEESLNFMTEHKFEKINYPVGFTNYEINSMQNVIDWFKSPIDSGKKAYLKDQFIKFHQEHDERRGTNSTNVIRMITSDV